VVRADRLLSVVLLLQIHGRMTAADLAARLETSERTIRRDLEALSGAGVPVYAERGRGGGWALLGGYRTDLTGLTEQEAQSLFLAAGPGALAGLGVEPAIESAMRKLLAALPVTHRRDVEAAQAAVVVDPIGWGRITEETPHLEALRDAVVAGRELRLTYAKPGHPSSPRVVDPYGLVSKAGTWYLLARSKGSVRTFRVSRVHAVEETGAPTQRPDDFDLADAWAQVRQDMEAREGCEVLVRAALGVVPQLHRMLGGGGRLQPVAGEGTAGWPAFTATFPAIGAAAAMLAGLGGRVEVLAPGEVRRALAAIGAELHATYGPP